MNCPFSHHQAIKDAGCHTAPVSPEARGHSQPFFFCRTINLKSPLLQQVLERRNEVLCVLTEKIVTTQKCVVSEHVQVEEKCGSMAGIRTKTVQVRPEGWGHGSCSGSGC